MKIGVAQTTPIKGDIGRNIEAHIRLIDLALANEAEMLIFPELSITGYEPELAKELATHADDSRFDKFQQISDSKQIVIGIGAPLKDGAGINIGMIIFQPNKPRQTYLKKYLHADEENFFKGGQNTIGLLGSESIAMAICYELSVPQHAEDAFNKGARIYIASAVEPQHAMERGLRRLAEIARTYSMTVLFSNCAGTTGGYDCPGKSSAWNSKGELLGQLNETNEGVLVLNTQTQQVICTHRLFVSENTN